MSESYHFMTFRDYISIFVRCFSHNLITLISGRSSITQPLRILVDEMLDGTDAKLRGAGYEAHSVKKLIEQGEMMHSDYSVLKYIEKHDLVLVTEDEQNIRGCEENGLVAIKYGQSETFENLLLGLEKLKNSDHD